MSRHGTAAPGTAQADSRAVAPSVVAEPVAPGPDLEQIGLGTPLRRARGLAGWPIRRKLAALVAVPVVVILVASGVIIGRTWAQLSDARRAGDIAALSIKANETSAALQRERSQTVIYLRTKLPTDKATMEDLRRRTDAAGVGLRSAFGEAPSGGWGDDIEIASGRADDALERLPSLRNGVSDNQRRPELVLSSFSNVFDGLQALTDALSSSLRDRAGNRRTQNSSAMLSALTAATAAAAEERDILTLALEQGSINERRYSRLSLLRAVQQDRLAEADKYANKNQHDRLLAIGANDDRLDRYRDDATFLLPDAGDDGTAGDAAAFTKVAGGRLNDMNDLVSDVAQQTRTAAAAAENRAWVNAISAGLGAAATLLFVTIATIAIGRTITDPLRRLRSGAVDVATTQLPTAVRRIEVGGGRGGVTIAPVLPPGTKAGPETVEVAAAVDGLTATAVRLATAQTELRRTLDEAFVNMSRRSQTMVEKQLGIIDELESTEQDPDQLRNLFRLDHLAARMRRYNDNLLVLAGAPVRTRSSAPIAVAELFRAATSEMEQYERVRLQPSNGVSVVGTAAGGLVHLLAELLDNAAMYSPPTSSIALSSQIRDDNGLVIEVRDSGVGIPAGELQRINARLGESEGFDLTVPSRMGLFVVGRLARRGGFSVQLMPRTDGEGIVAQVQVPPALVLGLGSRPSTATPLGGVPVVSGPAGALAPPPPTPRAGITSLDTTGGTVTESHDEAPLPRRQPRSTSAGNPPAATPAAPAATAAPGLFGSSDPAAVPAERLPLRPTSAARMAQYGAAAAAAGAGAAADATTALPPVAVPAAPPAAPSPLEAAPAGTGQLPPVAPSPINSGPPTSALGQAPQAWDSTLPTELAARATRGDESALIGQAPDPSERVSTPIFDSISVWFEAPQEAPAEVGEEPKDRARQLSSRWAALGDQRWIAANARAAAAPDTAGTTNSGLPMRRPGANLLPTAATIAPGEAAPAAAAPAASVASVAPAPLAPAAGPVTSSGLPTRQAGRSGAGVPAGAPAGRGPVLTGPTPNAEAVRGRLGSYQRGLSSARQARRQALAGDAASGAQLFSNAAAGASGANDTASDKGGDQ
ncbi:MAG: nitrate- and nitrite sensing domain-containing protein [Kineosporiaceae bacterium]